MSFENQLKSIGLNVRWIRRLSLPYHQHQYAPNTMRGQGKPGYITHEKKI